MSSDVNPQAEKQGGDAPEPWLRGTLGEVPAVQRAVLHALQLAREDVERWALLLHEEELFARPYGLAPFGFHVRHMAHSLDRLLTYAEGNELNVVQRAALGLELDGGMDGAALFAEFGAAVTDAWARVLALPMAELEAPRAVGQKRLPTTLGGLLVHVADHTQRHAGQAVVMAKLMVGLRG